MGEALDLHPFELVRVDDPDYPGADARSTTGAVLLERPPAGTPWRHESVPEPDVWPATEAIEALNASEWHERGVTGEGVKVAVFDLQWFGAEADPDVLGEVTTHDCYAHPSCDLPMDTYTPRFGFETGIHGYACAQVIRDIAPGVELHLVRVNGETTLENAVDWAVREGIDIISMSLSFFNTSFYDGSGSVNALMDKLVANDVLMVASAGNYATGHFKGPYIDANLDGRTEFAGNDLLPVYLGAGEGRFYVSWNQFRTCGLTDLDAYLRAADGDVVARGEDRQRNGEDHCSPYERLSGSVPTDGWYYLEVQHQSGPTTQLELNIVSTDGTIYGAIPEGSMTDPSSHPHVLSVGAVRAAGYLQNDIESFSSRGPTSDGRPKPDIAGPDGLTTQAYGAEGFYGTSAATPAVAAAIALVLSEEPQLGPYGAAERLQGWSLGDDATFDSPDPRWGSGKARLAVESDAPRACGERPLVLPLLLLPSRAWRRLRVHYRGS